MKRKSLAFLALVAVFAALVGYALWGELKRDEALIAESISGIVEVKPELFATGVADIVKTDRLALFLLDAASGKSVALKFESPLVPPQNIRIGQPEAQDGAPLGGTYVLVGIVDKDGEVFHVTPGEVYGRTSEPLKLGATGVRLVLDQPYRGGLANGGTRAPAMDSGVASEIPEVRERTIRGTIRVAPPLAANVSPRDRVIILLFDPEAGRPVATKIVPHARLPQAFSISLPPGVAPKAGYSLRVITDKDGNPFGAVPGEVVGRSAQPIPLGTEGVDFVLDQPYVR